MRRRLLLLWMVWAVVAACERSDNETNSQVLGERALGHLPGATATGRLIATAQQKVRARRDAAHGWVELATMLVRQKRETSDPSLLRLADDAVRAALAVDPRDRSARTLEVVLLQEDHRFAEARDAARELVHERPSDSAGHLLLGDALLELGDAQEAADAYQRAVDLRPGLATYERGAHLRWLHGDVAGAIELYQRAIEAGDARDPESLAWCWSELGLVYLRAGRTPDALSAAASALTSLPDYPPALRVRARALAAQGSRADAITVMTSLVERTHQVEDRLALAEWLGAEGRSAEAQSQITQAEANKREDPRAIALWYARHDREHSESLRLARLEISTRHGMYSQDVLSLALVRAGEIAAARQAIDQALALGTADARLMLHDALIALAEGKLAAARAAFDRARATEPAADPVLEAELGNRLIGGDAMR